MPARAQWMSMDAGMDLSIGAGNYLLSQQVLKNVVKKTSSKKAVPPRKSPVRKTTTPPRVTSAPLAGSSRFVRRGGYARSIETLAKTYPAAQQVQARQGYGALLEAYPAILRKLGQPENEVAVGMAAFIAGTYSAYHNRPFPDDRFAPLVATARRHG